MLAPIFHAWERRLASVTKDRVVRPFEWGEEWMDVGGLGPARPAGTGEAAVRAWVDAVMRDSQAFYTAPPTTAYTLTPATPDAAAAGDGGTLTFPSAMVTPHPENNVVSARWFPAKGHEALPRERRRAVVVMPQWNAGAGDHVGLAKLLARFGISALRLTKPYHDVRMPPELSRADYIVSANVVRTVQVCRQTVLDVRRAVAWLDQQGFGSIGLLGTSLGSCLSLLTGVHEPLVKAMALNHVSPWFADVVWRGLSTKHVRAGLDGHITLDTLRDLWAPISPWSYLDRLAGTSALMVYAKYDLTFPVDLSLTLLRECRRRGLPVEKGVLPCGHYSTGNAPFKFWDAYLMISYLRRRL
ncbi:MAG: alpha/beta hydrolase family protein [Vicinamibacterales bacterium]